MIINVWLLYWDIQKYTKIMGCFPWFGHWFKVRTRHRRPPLSVANSAFHWFAWHRARASKANSYLHNILVLHLFSCKPMTNNYFYRSLIVTLIFPFCRVSGSQLPVPRPQPHGLSHAKLRNRHWKPGSLPLLTPLWRQTFCSSGCGWQLH